RAHFHLANAQHRGIVTRGEKPVDMTQAVEHHLSPDLWDWVRDLIREVEREERCDDFLRQLFQWDLAVKEFRKAEQAKMNLGSPNERDLHCHATCLHALLAIGHSLILQSEQFKPEEFTQCNVKHGQIESYVEDLEQSLREWHHGFTAHEVKSAQD